MISRYDRLTVQLLSELDQERHLAAGEVPPIRCTDWDSLERDEEEIAIAIHELTDIAMKRWDSLTEVQREPHLEKAITVVKQRCSNSESDDGSPGDDLLVALR